MFNGLFFINPIQIEVLSISMRKKDNVINPENGWIPHVLYANTPGVKKAAIAGIFLLINTCITKHKINIKNITLLFLVLPNILFNLVEEYKLLGFSKNKDTNDIISKLKKIIKQTM